METLGDEARELRVFPSPMAVEVSSTVVQPRSLCGAKTNGGLVGIHPLLHWNAVHLGRLEESALEVLAQLLPQFFGYAGFSFQQQGGCMKGPGSEGTSWSCCG